MNIESRIENLRQSGNRLYKSAAVSAGIGAYNGLIATMNEGLMQKVSITSAAIMGTLSVASVIEGRRQHAQADRFEVVLAQHELTSTSMDTPSI